MPMPTAHFLDGSTHEFHKEADAKRSAELFADCLDAAYSRSFVGLWVLTRPDGLVIATVTDGNCPFCSEPKVPRGVVIWRGN